jgi:hypothetical protein
MEIRIREKHPGSATLDPPLRSAGAQGTGWSSGTVPGGLGSGLSTQHQPFLLLEIRLAQHLTQLRNSSSLLRLKKKQCFSPECFCFWSWFSDFLFRILSPDKELPPMEPIRKFYQDWAAYSKNYSQTKDYYKKAVQICSFVHFIWTYMG